MRAFGRAHKADGKEQGKRKGTRRQIASHAAEPDRIAEPDRAVYVDERAISTAKLYGMTACSKSSADLFFLSMHRRDHISIQRRSRDLCKFIAKTHA